MSRNMWNTIKNGGKLSALLSNSRISRKFSSTLFSSYKVRDNRFMIWTWCMSLVKGCSNMLQFKVIHAIFMTNGLHHNTYAVSKLLEFCALSDSGDLSYASQLFSQTRTPNIFIYNTLIKAYSSSSQPHFALHYFGLLLHDNEALLPDDYTFPFVLIACTNGLMVPEGKKTHCLVVKNSMSYSNSHVQTALIRFYVGCKALDDAHKVFEEIPLIDVVQANVLMNGYVRNGLASKALSVLQSMSVCEVEPDEFCMTSGLTACAHLGALEQGKWIHGYIKNKKELQSDVFLGTALVDMYAKCGCIDTAVEVFEAMPKRSKHSWATLIRGLGVHGFPKRAIDCLNRMQEEDGLRPDTIVLLGVLAACTHSGLQKEGQLLLANMEPLYGVIPQHEHFSCVVDLLCRAGKLDEAVNLIRTMPMKPRASVWGALLSGCRAHNNVTLAELAVKELLLLEDGNEAEEGSAYVQLSNIYLAARQTDDARKIRRIIGDKGLKKTPGISAIEVDGEVNEFVSGDVSHPHLAQIHLVLGLMSLEHPPLVVNNTV
ncbi:hypothetical protein DM860_014494 [Cuscuta australis]|uniref:Pentacotripeptide-repeat region of PRORP domain-containing protein n=1 Tax=Cuscuta australis TaxID=267555 RepID=A0A328DXW9_9ASTE|nr:hypothetical protein DM860_014494 [Cuscuta australis]